jgi:hypothetical protein
LGGSGGPGGMGNKGWGIAVRCLKDINTSVSISKISEDKFIYPNPANDELHVKNYKTSNTSDTFVMIYDLQGKLVIDIPIDSNPVNISNLSKGVYLVKIIDSGNIVVNKLIKE